MDISIIIPIKINLNEGLSEFADYILKLANDMYPYNCEVLIADESVSNVFNYLDEKFKGIRNIVHMRPDTKLRTGDNDKLNGIYAGLEYVNNDKILLVDDHYRITKETLIKVNEQYNLYDAFKFMPKFNKFSFTALVDLSGMFIVNILDYKKQYCGHLAFRKSHMNIAGFPSRDALFDELAMEEQLRKYGYRIGFIKEVALEATQEIPIKKFLEQRVRYAYENIALPFRFFFFSILLPIFIAISLIDLKLLFTVISTITIVVIMVSFLGQVVYGKNKSPFITFLFSPIWFWFYPFTTWIAIYKYFTGGVYFGGRKVRKAI